MDLGAIQGALSDAGADGWLFCDFRHRDLLSYRILGADPGHMTTRRWFYFVPAHGEPRGLAHRVEPRKLDGLPGRIDHYSAWTELHAKLRDALSGAKRVAMQYSANNDIPYVAIADAGTVELVRSFGHEIVSSADLVSRFEAVFGEDGVESHVWAGERVQKVKDEAFALMGESLRAGRRVKESEVRDFIVRRFTEEGLTCDGESPIVGFNDHPADPHFEPRPEIDYVLKDGDTILVDLWARRDAPGAIYYDITWCGFAGKEPPAEYRRIFEVARDARDAALALAEGRFTRGAAVAGWEVDDAARKVVDAAGYGEHFVHRTGHSIGATVHGNGANMDNFETRDVRRILPGTCFSIEPGIYLDGRMAVRTEIDAIVTPRGEVKVFGPVQRELIRLA